MEYYSAVKRNRLFIHITTWTDLKCTWLSERSHLKKGYIMHDFIYLAFWKEQNKRQKRYQWLSESGSERSQELTTKKFEGILVIKLICIVIVVGVIFLYATVKTHILIINYTTKK